MLAFSKQLRDLVEEFEPGVHEFRLMEVVPKDAGASPIPYFAVNIMSAVGDAIDFGRTVAPSQLYGERRLLLPLRAKDSGQVYISRATVVGKHLWITEEIVGSPITFSNELFQRAQAARLNKGYNAFELKEI